MFDQCDQSLVSTPGYMQFDMQSDMQFYMQSDMHLYMQFDMQPDMQPDLQRHRARAPNKGTGQEAPTVSPNWKSIGCPSLSLFSKSV